MHFAFELAEVYISYNGDYSIISKGIYYYDTLPSVMVFHLAMNLIVDSGS